MEQLILFNEATLITDLSAILTEAGIDISTWGKGTTKTLRHLAKEILQKESQIIFENGELIRQIGVAAITVTYRDETGTYLLREDHQVFANGDIRRRNWDSSVSEKMIQGESSIESFKRGLLQELHQIEERLGADWVDTLEFGEEHIEERTHYSDSYPGLKTERLVHSTIVELTPEQYIPEGYVEVQDGLTTVFKWQKVE
jgi:hypothetical protein